MLHWIGQNVPGWKWFSECFGSRVTLSETTPRTGLFTVSPGTPVVAQLSHTSGQQGEGNLPSTQGRSMPALSPSRSVVILLGIVAGAAIAVAETVNLESACINGLQVDINGGAVPGVSVKSITWTWGDGTSTTGFFPQSHTYSSPGPHIVNVTAHYNDASTASSSETVSVPGALSNCLSPTIAAGQGGSIVRQAGVGVAPALAVHAEDVSHCFVVNEMVKSEDYRYFIDAVSNCSREYDAVYVRVSFLDAKGRHLDDGVWAIYWCRPGRRELHEFGIPSGAAGFKRVALRKITVDFMEALR